MAEQDTIETPPMIDAPIAPEGTESIEGPGPKPKGFWVNDLGDYLNKKPDASDEDLYKQFPQLGHDSKKLDAANSYLFAKGKGTPDDQLEKMYPDLVPPSPMSNPMNRQVPRGTPGQSGPVTKPSPEVPVSSPS